MPVRPAKRIIGRLYDQGMTASVFRRSCACSLAFIMPTVRFCWYLSCH